MKKRISISIFYIILSLVIFINIFAIIVLPHPFNIVAIITLSLTVVILIHTILNFDNMFIKPKEEYFVLNEYKSHVKQLLEKNDNILKRHYHLDNIRIEYKKNMQILRKTQSSILPKKLDVYKNAQCSIFYTPSEIISGDFYDYFKINDDKSMFIISDISGHGIAAATITSMLKAMFSIYAKLITSPKDLLSSINNSMIQCMPNNYCLSAIAVLFDKKNKTITYANASHPPFFVIRNSEIIEHSESDTIIGLFPKAAYSEYTIKLQKNDTLFFYTDGITEASNSRKKNELYGTERLKEAILKSSNMKLDEMVTFIKYDLFRYISFQAPSDDCTMIAFKII